MMVTILCLTESAQRTLNSTVAAQELAEGALTAIAETEVRLFSRLNRRCQDIEDDIESARLLAMHEQMANADTRLSISRQSALEECLKHGMTESTTELNCAAVAAAYTSLDDHNRVLMASAARAAVVTQLAASAPMLAAPATVADCCDHVINSDCDGDAERPCSAPIETPAALTSVFASAEHDRDDDVDATVDTTRQAGATADSQPPPPACRASSWKMELLAWSAAPASRYNVPTCIKRWAVVRFQATWRGHAARRLRRSKAARHAANTPTSTESVVPATEPAAALLAATTDAVVAVSADPPWLRAALADWRAAAELAVQLAATRADTSNHVSEPRPQGVAGAAPTLGSGPARQWASIPRAFPLATVDVNRVVLWPTPAESARDKAIATAKPTAPAGTPDASLASSGKGARPTPARRPRSALETANTAPNNAACRARPRRPRPMRTPKDGDALARPRRPRPTRAPKDSNALAPDDVRKDEYAQRCCRSRRRSHAAGRPKCLRA